MKRYMVSSLMCDLLFCRCFVRFLLVLLHHSVLAVFLSDDPGGDQCSLGAQEEDNFYNPLECSYSLLVRYYSLCVFWK